MGGGRWCAEPITSSCFRPPPLPTAASFRRRRSSIMGPTCSSSSSSSSTSSLTVSSKSSPDIVRHWVQPQLPHPSPTLSSQERFKVMSYNILSDKNATKHSDMYDHVPSAYMTWAHRKTVICEELMGWNPDLICLQEVDKYHDLSSTLEKAGFLGSYKRRSGDIVDGCAMFWKADKFRLLDTETIEFKRYGLRDNVAQLSVFEGAEKIKKVVEGVVIQAGISPEMAFQSATTRAVRRSTEQREGEREYRLSVGSQVTPYQLVQQFVPDQELKMPKYGS